VEVTYARLRATDPGRWRASALAWRRWAAVVGRWASDLGGQVSRLLSAWSGAAATAAADYLGRLRQRLSLFRVACWTADQALSEFAAALGRARALLARAVETARRAGLAINDSGGVEAPEPIGVSAAPVRAAYRTTVRRAAATEVSADLAAALSVAAAADEAAAGRIIDVLTSDLAAPALPLASAGPDDVRRWWAGLSPGRRRWLAVTRAASLGSLDGVPAGYRDLANRLRLAEQRADLDRAVAGAAGGERRRLRVIRDALDALADRLDGDDGPRGYLLRLDPAGEGRAVVALGDPDRAGAVLTHVPGMTADLASYDKELARAERVAVRAGELDPATATSAVMWLDYDAPDFLDEAAGRSRAEAGAVALRRFQDGLRASHEDGPARHTVLGHSYGSLVVGSAAAVPGLAADRVVFVGSPGVGVESAGRLHLPPGEVWSTTSRSDVIQYAPVAPDGLVKDLALSRLVPGAGALLAFGRPEDELWHGRNPSDPAFGARVFASQADAGHPGYWEPGRPALDALANITLGRSDVGGDVTPR
jgi:hypothetical protein